jgi:hypothetical protein
MNPSERIDELIAKLTDWRGKTIAGIRKSILEAERLSSVPLLFTISPNRRRKHPRALERKYAKARRTEAGFSSMQDRSMSRGGNLD